MGDLVLRFLHSLMKMQWGHSMGSRAGTRGSGPKLGLMVSLQHPVRCPQAAGHVCVWGSGQMSGLGVNGSCLHVGSI